jgi:hypothetical protein
VNQTRVQKFTVRDARREIHDALWFFVDQQNYSVNLSVRRGIHPLQKKQLQFLLRENENKKTNSTFIWRPVPLGAHFVRGIETLGEIRRASDLFWRFLYNFQLR